MLSAGLDEAVRLRLASAAARFGTPTYVYDWNAIAARAAALQRAFGPVASLSYAVKANPNTRLLARLGTVLPHFDVSSIGELERLHLADVPPGRVSFTGPGKRDFEIARAVHLRVGHIVCESPADVERTATSAAREGIVQAVLLRVNPLNVPPKFGAHMGGGASQFGIDEETIPDVVKRISRLPSIRLEGFHVFPGSNCLDTASLERHFELATDLFGRLSAGLAAPVRRLVIGSGFGIAYHPGDQPLSLDDLAPRVVPIIDAARRHPALSAAAWELEMGRYLVADAGWLLTSVIDVKVSRGRDIAILDAGFNNHLAAAGLMGSLLRRNWPISAVTAAGPPVQYTLVGPLCTSIDTLGTKVELPGLASGDVLAIGASGAYGYSASPSRFISHPEPREVLLDGDTMIDVTEKVRIPSFDEQSIQAGPGWTADVR